jgi:hypothetical protein
MHADFFITWPAEKPVWMARLARCEAAADVMEVVREFVRAHQTLWVCLPTDCQPPPFTVADDISRYALSLYRRELVRNAAAAANVRALASFFSEASHRMASVMAASAPSFRFSLANPETPGPKAA